MGPSFGEVVAILAAMLTPALLLLYFAKRWFELEDRLVTLERIVTDQPARLAREIDQLSIDKKGRS